MVYAYALSAPPAPRAVPPHNWALIPVCQCPVYIPCSAPAALTPPPPVQVCIKWGDQYQRDTVRLDMEDHKVTLTRLRGAPLVLTTAMVAGANYERTWVALVLVPSTSGAQALRDPEWKGWSVAWRSYAKAVQPARPTGFKVMGARAPALRNRIIPRLTGERPTGTPSLTSVFGILGKDLRATQASTRVPEPAPGGLSWQALEPEDSPPLTISKWRARQWINIPWATYGPMSVAGTYGSDYWRKPHTWQRAAPWSSSWPRLNPDRAMKPPHSWTTHATSSFPPMARRGPVLTCMSARGPPHELLYPGAMRTLMPS